MDTLQNKMEEVAKLCLTVEETEGCFDPFILRHRGCMTEDVYQRWCAVSTHTFLNFLLGLQDSEFRDVIDSATSLYPSPDEQDIQLDTLWNDVMDKMKLMEQNVNHNIPT